MIANPEYKGPWSPKMIDNPAYKVGSRGHATFPWYTCPAGGCDPALQRVPG